MSTVSESLCCMTHHPKTYWLKQQTCIISHNSVSWHGMFANIDHNQSHDRARFRGWWKTPPRVETRFFKSILSTQQLVISEFIFLCHPLGVPETGMQGFSTLSLCPWCGWNYRCRGKWKWKNYKECNSVWKLKGE